MRASFVVILFGLLFLAACTTPVAVDNPTDTTSVDTTCIETIQTVVPTPPDTLPVPATSVTCTNPCPNHGS